MRIMMTAPALIAALALTTAATGQPVASRQTRDFVQAAGESDAFEILEAHTALAQSEDPQVLAFARQMIHDHGETHRKLRAAAQLSGAEPPGDLVGAGQAPFLAALQSLRGGEFDRAYWDQQALAHRSALVSQQGYASTGDVPAIRQVAAQAVPLIQSHLKMAEQMKAGRGQP